MRGASRFSSRQTPMSERLKFAAGDNRRASSALKGRVRVNRRQCRPSGGPWSQGNMPGSARMRRNVTGRSSSRNKLAW